MLAPRAIQYLELRAPARYRTTTREPPTPAATPASRQQTNANAFAPACAIGLFHHTGAAELGGSGVNPVANTTMCHGPGIDPCNFAVNGSMSRLTAWATGPMTGLFAIQPHHFLRHPPAPQSAGLAAQPVTYPMQ